MTQDRCEYVERCREKHPDSPTMWCFGCYEEAYDATRAALREAERSKGVAHELADKYRQRNRALEAALRRFEGWMAPTIINNDGTTRHFAGCDGYECRKPNPVMDAGRCAEARRALEAHEGEPTRQCLTCRGTGKRCYYRPPQLEGETEPIHVTEGCNDCDRQGVEPAVRDGLGDERKDSG